MVEHVFFLIRTNPLELSPEERVLRLLSPFYFHYKQGVVDDVETPQERSILFELVFEIFGIQAMKVQFVLNGKEIKILEDFMV